MDLWNLKNNIMLERHSIIDLSILPELKDKTRKNEYKIINGVNVKMTSQRYEVFKESLTCKCGLTGSFFAIERQKEQNAINWHLNLYGFNESGDEILMTKDHIKAKSKGGRNIISNYETMCFPCNFEKGNS